MGTSLNLNESPPEDDVAQYFLLKRDKKPICFACVILPVKIHAFWEIVDFKPKEQYLKFNLPRCQLHPKPQNDAQKKEWGLFTDWMRRNKKAAIVISNSCDFYILPSNQGQELSCVQVFYRIRSAQLTSNSKVVRSLGDVRHKHRSSISESSKITERDDFKHEDIQSRVRNKTRTYVNTSPCEDICESASESHRIAVLGESTSSQSCRIAQLGKSTRKDRQIAILDDRDQKMKINPSYLNTLGQTHAWAFGAIAELVDNSRDARATRLDIFVEPLYLRNLEKEVPVLVIVDDGHGMSHNELVRMLSFGHKQPDEDDVDHIGRFGLGFKTGAMKLGKDVVIVTQTSTSRSIGLFSQAFNENKDNVENPIITYCRHGNYMDVDLNVQSETCASKNLNAIKEFTPFNEYFIGEKFKLFDERGTGSGTQVYIWNLDKWGSNYTLEWVAPGTSENSSQRSNGDILIRSRRLRSRPGQISREVPLDYSLQAYLEVIFLDPRMKIYVQGSPVNSRPLAKSLSKTAVLKGQVMGKPIQLTLGRCCKEWERVNCGIFLYWHGRLIEAYKRVGGMEHNSDMGRGVIGVVDVSNIMDDGEGHVLVMNSKQGFQDCEEYARLEEWLGKRADEYWDKNFDALELQKRTLSDKPDHEWVQCNNCRKWRMLSIGFDTKSLPDEWFCYMPPFSGKCETPEQQQESGVITVSEKQSRSSIEQVTVQCEQEEAPDSNSNLSGSNNRIPTPSSCKRQENCRITSAREKKEQIAASSLPNLKNIGKGTGGSCKRSSRKDKSEELMVEIESAIQPKLKRLRKGLPRKRNQT